MKPEKPITRKEMYLDVATGGSTELPSPVTREEKYLAKIAGESVDIPTPVTRYEMLLAAVAGESYTLTPVTRLEIYLAKAAGQDVEIPQPVTREEMYWFDYCGGTPTPPEREYTGAVPVTFVADGTPLLDYTIYGNTVQSGTPTPDSPVMPKGTGERTGNLFDSSTSVAGLIDNNGDIISNFAYSTSEFIRIDAEFTISLISIYTPSPRLIRCGYYTESKQHIANEDSITFRDGYKALSFTPPDGTVYIRFSFITREEYADTQIMLNLGSTPLPYEPYGVKIPISSANTTTPVYLGEVRTTRRIKKLALSSSQNWKLQSINSHGIANFYITITNDFLNISSVISNYFTRQTMAIADTTTEGTLIALSTNTATVYIRIKSQTASTAQEFKNWLDGLSEEAAIWYVLATEQTAVVNEPLMKIGDYADTLSMEQAGAQIPTANGSTTLDVDTTVPPSEVYIKYRGEAVATLSALPAEVSSPETTTEEENLEETEEEENGSEDISLQH